MTFPFPGILWILIAFLIVGMILLISAMRLRKTDQDGIFVLGDAPDGYQKTRVLIAHAIIDSGLILSWIAVMIYVAPNIFYMLCMSLTYAYFLGTRVKDKGYKIYIDYFRNLHRKPER